MPRRGCAALVLLCGLLFSHAAQGDIEIRGVADLSPDLDWVVDAIDIEGNQHLSTGAIREPLRTRTRPWYMPWRRRPRFDPAVFERDLERLARVYESQGFFAVRVVGQVQGPGDGTRTDVSISIHIEEGPRARVVSLEVSIDGRETRDPKLLASLPLRRGMPFSEDAYRESERQLRRARLDTGYAHAKSTRAAEVSLDRQSVAVVYGVETGSIARFDTTEPTGLADVDPHIVLRELRYAKGDLYSLKALEETRQALLDLQLFSVVRLERRDSEATPDAIPIEIRLVERPPREIRIGVSYSTESEFGARLGWRHYNWLGGARQLSLSGQYSTITSSAEADLLQPHLFGRSTQGLLGFRLFQDDEDTYTLRSLRLVPRVQYQAPHGFSLSMGFRVQGAQTRDISQAVRLALGGVRRDGLLFGPSLGLEWKGSVRSKHLKLGARYALRATQIGDFWGGDYDFYALTGELAHSLEPGFGFELALMTRLSFVDALGDESNLPIFERLYAGGQGSVRGYARRDLGPKSANGEALGGLSRLEAAVELRRRIWGDLGGALFFDIGQVSRQRFDLSRRGFEYSAGPGLTYATPVGPLSLYIGFPLDPFDAQRWEVHFSVGYFF